MIEYNLSSFNGDVKEDGKAISIISWNGDINQRDICRDITRNIRTSNLTGLGNNILVWSIRNKRPTLSLGSVYNQVVITVDMLQHKISLITYNSNILILHNIVDCIINSYSHKVRESSVRKLLRSIKLLNNKIKE